MTNEELDEIVADLRDEAKSAAASEGDYYADQFAYHGCGEAADAIEWQRAEITRLRERLALWDACAQKSVQMYGGCVRPEYEQLLRDAATSLAGLVRLTDAEREAVRFCVTASLPETEKLGGVAGELCRRHGDTLRSLMERLGGGE
jgi:hypothetical protein